MRFRTKAAIATVGLAAVMALGRCSGPINEMIQKPPVVEPAKAEPTPTTPAQPNEKEKNENPEQRLAQVQRICKEAENSCQRKYTCDHLIPKDLEIKGDSEKKKVNEEVLKCVQGILKECRDAYDNCVRMLLNQR